MAIYEYRCPSGHLSEVLDVSNKTRLPSIDCPVCGAVAEKVPSVTHWQQGDGGRGSAVSRAIDRVQAAERHTKR